MMINNTKINKKPYSFIDIYFLLLIPIAAAVLTLILPLNLFESTLLFFGPTALYISWRRKDIITRSLIFALCFTVISILTDYLAERDLSWVSTSVFHIRLLGVVPIEALVWVFLFTYLIIAYYQFFFDHVSHKVVGKRMPIVFLVALGVFIWFCITAIQGINSLALDYFYIKFGVVIILLPLLIFVFNFPQYLRIFLKTAPYFIAFGLLNILVSLYKGYWSYPGHHYIGWVGFGTYRFPVEELVFWIILYSSFVISQFEFFDNDQLKFKSKLRFRSRKT